MALIWHNQHPVAVYSDHPGPADSAFNVLMLVSMEHELRFCSLDVLVECLESHVHVVLAIVDQARGVVRYENIDRGKAGQKGFNLKLLK